MKITRKGQALLIDFEGDKELRRLYNNEMFIGFGVPHLPFKNKMKRLYGFITFSALTTERHLQRIYSFIESQKDTQIIVSNQAKTIFKKYIKKRGSNLWDSMKFTKLT